MAMQEREEEKEQNELLLKTNYMAKPFLPDKDEDYNTDYWHKKAEQHSKRNFNIRVARISFILSGPFILLTATTIAKLSVSLVLAIGLFFMFVVYFGVVVYYVFFSNNRESHELYRVYSISEMPDNWRVSLNVSYIQLLYEKHSIESISELSAIHGGVTKTMLNTLGAYTWISIAIHYAVLIKWSDNFGWDIADFCEIIGVMGLLFISVFELDPWNYQMRMMHYIGAGLGSGTVIGCNIQQYSLMMNGYSSAGFIIALIMGLICASAFVSWMVIGAATNISQREKDTVRGKKLYSCIWTPMARGIFGCAGYECKDIGITAYSRLNVGFEAIFLFLGAASLCLFLFRNENVCKFGCANQP